MKQAYTEFGEMLRIAREKRRLDQRGLAKALGTTQQTVSRWEKGESRPKSDLVHKMAELFDDDVDEWLAKAGYKITKPVAPLLDWLPLESLSEEKFELFNTDLIAKLHPSADVYRYGHKGHKQDGVDIIAKEHGEKTDYQAKRHKQFGKEKVHAAVKATTKVAKHHHILLSRQATTDARDAIDEYDDWSIWDVEDISRKVRSLPPQDRLDLVDTYFPGYRKDFLGIAQPSLWLTTEKYFRSFNNRSQIFNHEWSFYGRKEELGALSVFATSDQPQAQLLVGRGGVGKTRILKEVAESLKGVTEVRFMTQRAEPRPSDIEILPRKGILIIEDSHEYPDLRALLSRLAIERPNLKVLLSLRPYGLTYLEGNLIEAGMSFDQSATIHVGDLKKKDAISLASQVLTENGAAADYAERIAVLTLDCPLATVVGAKLVAGGEIDPAMLNNSDEFRVNVMSRFKDVITGKVAGNKDAEDIQELLSLVSVLQPIQQTDPVFESVAKEILGKPYDKVLREIRSLEDAGVIVRRNSGIRIAPDLLGDYIRAEATYYSKSKSPTGYADRVFKAARGELAINLLVNLSQLDWRLTADGYQAALLETIWTALRKEFLEAEINERAKILKAVEKVAYYQPAESLKFVQLALKNPTNHLEKTEFQKLMNENVTYAKVISSLPEITKLAAYNATYLPEALCLLKEISQLMDKPTGPRSQDDPVSVMKELVVIAPRKPLAYIEIGVNQVLNWVGEKGLNFSPFDVLDGALITEGHDAQFNGKSMTLNSFKVRVDLLKEVRQKIINAAFDSISNGTTKEAIRAVSTLEEALRGPVQHATDSDKEELVPSQVELLDRLCLDASKTNLDPFVSVQIRRAVNWHSNYSKSATRPAALEVLKNIPNNFEFNLSRALADDWGWTFERGENFERDEKRFNEWKAELVGRTIHDFDGRYQDLIQILEKRISVLQILEMPGSSDGGRFVYELMKSSEQLARELGRHLIDNPESPLKRFLGFAIGSIADHDYPNAIDLANEAVITGGVESERLVAYALGWMISENVPPQDEELQLIKKLATSEDVMVRKNLVNVVRRFPATHHLTALSLLNMIRFEDNELVAEEILSQFHESRGGFKLEQLSSSQLDSIFEGMASLKTLEEYSIQKFIQDASYHYPDRVLKLMFDRVDNKLNLDYKSGFRPLPTTWAVHVKLRFSETQHYQVSLAAVREWVNEGRESWPRQQYGAEIFHAVSAGFDDASFKILNEWCMSDDPNQVETAASILSGFPANYMWDNPELFITILEHAAVLGTDVLATVSSYLREVASREVRTGDLGEPFPQDVLQSEMSAKILSGLPSSSAAYKFFEELKDVAQKSIEREHMSDQS